MTKGSQESASTALALPPDIRAELLKAQGESIGGVQSLPQIRVMGLGAGLFEFKDTSETAKTFEGVILGAHAQNVLWDRDAEEEAATDLLKRPACSSVDGKTGIPREGFEHIMLGGSVAQGNERIDCASCKYAAFGSGAMLIPKRNPKGKAVTNQKMVYVLIPGRETPMELVLNAMSLKNYDHYATSMLNAGVPTQAVVTRFSQEVVTKSPTIKYGTVKLSRGDSLDMESFQTVIAKRREYMHFIAPVVEELVEALPDEDTLNAVGDSEETNWLNG